jgi:hypothetical protein
VVIELKLASAPDAALPSAYALGYLNAAATRLEMSRYSRFSPGERVKLPLFRKECDMNVAAKRSAQSACLPRVAEAAGHLAITEEYSCSSWHA